MTKRANKGAQKKKQIPPRGCRASWLPTANEQQARLGGPAQQQSSLDGSISHEATTDEDVDEEGKKEEEEPQLPHLSVLIPNGSVFDISALLRMERGDDAISTLKFALTNGDMNPSPLLYDELLDCLADAETYSAAHAIFSTLVWVSDVEFGKSKVVSFPRILEPLMSALQDANVQPMGELSWCRNLLVIQLFVSCLQRDFCACNQRRCTDGALSTDMHWVSKTRVSRLLQDGRSTRAGRLAEPRNDWILRAGGLCTALWKPIHDGDEGEDAQAGGCWELARESTANALLRLIEMLFRCTMQADNLVQRICAGMDDMRAATRDIFIVSIQCVGLSVRIAAMNEIDVKTLLDRPSSASASRPHSDFEQFVLEIWHLMSVDERGYGSKVCGET